MCRYLSSFLLMVLSLSVVACGSSNNVGTKTDVAKKDSHDDKEKPVVHGKITQVDATAKTLTLQQKKGADVSMTVADDAKITVDDKVATLADVKVGMFANAHRKKGDATVAVQVHAHTKNGDPAP